MATTATRRARARNGNGAAPRPTATAADPLTLAQAALTEVEARRDALEAALVSSRGGLAAAEKALEAARSTFGEALAEQELRGGADPARDAFDAAERGVRDAQSKLAALERRRPEVQEIWTSARRRLLDATIASLYAQVVQAEERKEAHLARRWKETQAADKEAHAINGLLAQLNSCKRELDVLNREAASA